MTSTGSPIRLMYVTSTFRNCGPTIQLLNILRHMNYDEFDISIVTLSPEADDSLIDEVETLPVKLHPLDMGRINSLLRRRRPLEHAIESIGPDVIHSHGWRPDSIISQLSNQGTCWIATCRNIPDIDYPSKFGPIAGRYAARSHVKALQRCSNLICCSHALRSEYRERYGISCASVIPNGIELFSNAVAEFTRYGDGRVRAVTVGQLITRKNVSYLYDLFRLADPAMATLAVVGEGPERARLDDGRYATISFVGQQDRQGVHRYLAESDVFASASVAEGLPAAVLEALSMGLPCLLSDIGPHRELQSEMPPGAVELFSLSDPAASVAKQLPHYLARLRKAPRAEISKRARETYSALRMSRRYQALYSSIMHESRHP